MADIRRLVDATIPPDLAREIGAQIDAGTGNRRRLVELGMVPVIAAEVAAQIGGTASALRLIELGMSPATARQLSVAIGGGPIVVPPLPVIPPILTPFTIGVNGQGTQAYTDGFLVRDLAWHGEWIVNGGALNNQKLPMSMIDRQTFFPTSIPSDATGAQLKIFDGAWISEMGDYTVSIDSRFSVQNFTSDPNIVLSSFVGGVGTASITGTGRSTGWSLKVTGPFATLTAAQRGLRILPKNDAHPERLYSDGYRAMLEVIGAREYRVMEDTLTNSFTANRYSMFGDFGPKTGTTGSPIDAIVQMCNDTNSGLYYAFHPAAPIEEVVANARYVAKNLKKGLGFTVEYSNEIWNGIFPARTFLQEKAWRAGLYGNAGNGTKPACLGWENGDLPAFAGGRYQPFESNYRVDPNNTSEAYKGRTTQAISAGSYIIGNIDGFGNNLFLVGADIPSGYVFPNTGDSNVVRQADDASLENGKWRYYSEKSQALLATVSDQWLAEGHSADKLYVALNVQSGAGLNVDDFVLSWPDGSFKQKNFEVDQAPYWSTYYGDVGDLSIAKTLDAVAIGDRAQIVTRSTWVSSKRAALQTKMPAGRILPVRASGTYEVNHHNGFLSGTDNRIKFNALRRDPRMGHNLKLAMTYFGIENPGGYFRVFNLITGEHASNTAAWGVFFTNNEALTGPLVNPEAIALKEWTTAAVTGVPVADIFCPTNPDEGPLQVQIQFGPQVAQAISGVLRVTAGTADSGDVTGGLPLDIPFTKAAGAIVATVTVPVIADGVAEGSETLVLSIVPQPSVFTIGSLSQAVTITLADAPVDTSQIYDIDDDLRAVGTLPRTGTGSSRSLSRGWSVDWNYASDGFAYMDKFAGPRFFGSPNAKNRKILLVMDTRTWVTQFDNLQVDLIASESGSRRVRITYNAADGFWNVGDNAATPASRNVPLPTTARAIFTMEISIVGGKVKMFLDGNEVTPTGGVTVATDYLATAKTAVELNTNQPVATTPLAAYRRIALKGLPD